MSGSDTASWYQMWEVVTAVFSVCVRHRQGGGARGLGELLSISKLGAF